MPGKGEEENVMTLLGKAWEQGLTEGDQLNFRMMKLANRLADIRARVAQDLLPDERYREVEKLVADGYEPTAALAALQLLASEIIVQEVPKDRLQLALQEIARRFEALDDWMTAGGQMPEQWRKRR